MQPTLRYVLLRHEHVGVHYDLMFESGSVLKTWKLLQPPEMNISQSAEQLFDHRLIYLDYEGPISGNRGSVRRWDAGTYRGEIDHPTDIEIELSGGRWCGRLTLVHRQASEWELRVGSYTRRGQE